MRKRKILVTEPSLPPLSEFYSLLDTIWRTRKLTNGGSFSQQFESSVARFLKVPHVSLLSSGTTALFTAIKSLELTGEVITTPFTFPATTQQIRLAGLTPVFVDIDSTTFNLDHIKISEAITPATSAILAVHCFGVPCNVDAIQSVADQNGLRVIYDAAHAFGVDCDCGELFTKGDVSILSFHATKVFNTFEGGAVATSSSKIKKFADNFKNFGIGEHGISEGPGINGKMSEINAALGLLQIKYIRQQIYSRKLAYDRYSSNLKNCSSIIFPSFEQSRSHNYSYLPIRIKSDGGNMRDRIILSMNKKNIFPRKYFHPLVSNLKQFAEEASSIHSNLPVANRITEEVLCLPIFENLTMSEVDEICDIILNV